MITQSFPSLRKKLPIVNYGYQPPTKQNGLYTVPIREGDAKDRARAIQMGITLEEFVRRDAIVRAAWLNCNFKIGEVLCPVSKQSRDKYGTNITVEVICRSYHDFNIKDEWPKDDEPFILIVRPEKGTKDGGRILCTPGFLMRPVNNASSC